MKCTLFVHRDVTGEYLKCGRCRFAEARAKFTAKGKARKGYVKARKNAGWVESHLNELSTEERERQEKFKSYR